MAERDPRMPIVVCQVFPSSAANKRPAETIRRPNALYLAAVKANPQASRPPHSADRPPNAQRR